MPASALHELADLLIAAARQHDRHHCTEDSEVSQIETGDLHGGAMVPEGFYNAARRTGSALSERVSLQLTFG